MKFITLVPFLLLGSCASIVSKTSYPVNITSSPSGSHVTVRDQDGSVVHQGTTPTSVTLSARGGYFKPARYTFEFIKRGLPSQTVNLTSEMDGWYFGNILIGGLVGMLVVDPATGAMWQLPENVNANLTPIASISNGSGKSLQIVELGTVPASVEAQLVALH